MGDIWETVLYTSCYFNLTDRELYCKERERDLKKEDKKYKKLDPEQKEKVEERGWGEEREEKWLEKDIETCFWLACLVWPIIQTYSIYNDLK